MENLSQALEAENRLEEVVKELEPEKRPTQMVEEQDLFFLAREGNVHLAPIAYIFLILYILYITIGMGRTYLNK